MPNTDTTNGPEADTQVRHAQDSSGQDPESGVVKTLSELARELRADQDMTTLLQHIVAAVVAELDGADYAGITEYENRTVHAVAATNPLVERLDNAQQQLDEGPCLSSLRQQVTVRSDDFGQEQRWPKFVAAALGEGVRCMMSVQLFVDGDNLGALNLYATRTDAFGAHDEYTAMALAAHAAVAMKGARMESNLRTALGSRDIIGQAKGILMERYKISADDAFGLLVLSSQRANLKLREIADELTTSGELRVT